MLVYLEMMDTPEEKSKFEVLYVKYKKLMYYVAFGILKNEEDAEDAVHQAFLNVAENMEKIDDAVSVRTKSFLVTIAENRALDICRQRMRRQEVPYEEGLIGLNVEYTGSVVLAYCITKLPPNLREVILMKYRHGCSDKAIAKAFNVSEVYVRKLIQRAKEKLHDLCQEEGLM